VQSFKNRAKPLRSKNFFDFKPIVDEWARQGLFTPPVHRTGMPTNCAMHKMRARFFL
jgi:hypothetical protein